MACTLSSKMGEKTPPLFSRPPTLLKSENCPTHPPFNWLTHFFLKKSDFSVNPIILKLKVTKFLVKLSDLNSYTEKSIFVYKRLFCQILVVLCAKTALPAQRGWSSVLGALELLTERLHASRRPQ